MAKYMNLTIIVALIVAFLGSCSKPDYNTTETNSTTSATPVISTTGVVTQFSSVILVETTTQSEIIVPLTEYEKAVLLYAEYIGILEEGALVKYGMPTNGYLYDFDIDGIPEWFYIDTSGLIGEMCICKLIDDKVFVIDETILITQGNREEQWWFTVPNIDLYYDKLNNDYFYVIEHHMWEKYFNYAEVNKFFFKDNELVISNIARCEFDIGYGDGNYYGINITSNKLLGEDTTPMGIILLDENSHYYDGVEEYLSQFEKIRTITLDELMANSLEDAVEQISKK
jgi:hypothetical protein